MLPNDITVNVVMKDVGAVATRQAAQSQGIGQVARSASGAETTNDLTQTEHIQQKAVASNAKEITVTPPAKAEGPIEHYRVTLDVSNLHALAGGVVDQDQGGATSGGSGVMTSPDGDTVEISPELLAASADQPTVQEGESTGSQEPEKESDLASTGNGPETSQLEEAAPTPAEAAQSKGDVPVEAARPLGQSGQSAPQSVGGASAEEADSERAEPVGPIQDTRSSGIVEVEDGGALPVDVPGEQAAPVTDKRQSGLTEPTGGTADTTTVPVKGEEAGPPTDARASGLVEAPEGQTSDKTDAGESPPPAVTDHRTSGIEVSPPPDEGQQSQDGQGTDAAGEGNPVPETPDAGSSPADPLPAETETGDTPASPGDGNGAGQTDGAATPGPEGEADGTSPAGPDVVPGPGAEKPPAEGGTDAPSQTTGPDSPVAPTEIEPDKNAGDSGAADAGAVPPSEPEGSSSGSDSPETPAPGDGSAGTASPGDGTTVEPDDGSGVSVPPDSAGDQGSQTPPGEVDEPTGSTNPPVDPPSEPTDGPGPDVTDIPSAQDLVDGAVDADPEANAPVDGLDSDPTKGNADLALNGFTISSKYVPFQFGSPSEVFDLTFGDTFKTLGLLSSDGSYPGSENRQLPDGESLLRTDIVV